MRDKWFTAFCIMLALVFFALPAAGMDYQGVFYLDWDGTDASGAIEQSTPITVSIYNADTQVMLTQLIVDQPVTDEPFPVFTGTVPDNVTSTVHLFARAIDSEGNASGDSAIQEYVLEGNDTVPPPVPVISGTISGL